MKPKRNRLISPSQTHFSEIKNPVFVQHGIALTINL
jgi:hypothetical protein